MSRVKKSSCHTRSRATTVLLYRCLFFFLALNKMTVCYGYLVDLNKCIRDAGNFYFYIINAFICTFYAPVTPEGDKSSGRPVPEDLSPAT